MFKLCGADFRWFAVMYLAKESENVRFLWLMKRLKVCLLCFICTIKNPQASLQLNGKTIWFDVLATFCLYPHGWMHLLQVTFDKSVS